MNIIIDTQRPYYNDALNVSRQRFDQLMDAFLKHPRRDCMERVKAAAACTDDLNEYTLLILITALGSVDGYQILNT